MVDRQDGGEAAATVILVVEDEALVRMVVSDTLADAGYRVIDAVNADDALLLLGLRADVEAVVTDVQMPSKLDGFARIVAERWPGMGLVVSSAGAQPAPGDLPPGTRYPPWGISVTAPGRWVAPDLRRRSGTDLPRSRRGSHAPRPHQAPGRHSLRADRSTATRSAHPSTRLDGELPDRRFGFPPDRVRHHHPHPCRDGAIECLDDPAGVQQVEFVQRQQRASVKAHPGPLRSALALPAVQAGAYSMIVDRHRNLLSDVAGTVSGLGPRGHRPRLRPHHAGLERHDDADQQGRYADLVHGYTAPPRIAQMTRKAAIEVPSESQNTGPWPEKGSFSFSNIADSHGVFCNITTSF
jgi:hypothetical protein